MYLKLNKFETYLYFLMKLFRELGKKYKILHLQNNLLHLFLLIRMRCEGFPSIFFFLATKSILIANSNFLQIWITYQMDWLKNITLLNSYVTLC